jgi:DNA modification methylase
MTNCVSYEESMEQYRFVAKEVSRLTKPGRVTCVHCTDLKRGSIFQRDFPGDIIRVHEEVGFNFFCRITIWKDPWHFARRTRMRNLMHKMIVQDSSFNRIAPPDYLIVFRKSGQNEVPITHKHGLTVYAGEEQIPADLIRDYSGFKGDQRKNLLSHWIWRKYASPVWMDIRRKRMLPHHSCKEKPEEKHVCPLQLDVIERCLTLWSNPGDVVLTPFMGIGSEAYMAVRMERRPIGIELKATYYRQAARNVEAALRNDINEDVSQDIDEEADEDAGDDALPEEEADVAEVA